jgi:hypothetical protein
MRIQVLDVLPTQPHLWRIPIGNLLIVGLLGRCDLQTETEKHQIVAGDQALLAEGEQFSLQRVNPDEPAMVQMIWAPGISRDP